jgi:hypothetical protein
MRVVIATLLAGLLSAARAADLEIGGYLLCGNDCLVIIRDPATKLRSSWIKLGEQWNGYYVACDSAGKPLIRRAAIRGESSDALPYDGYQEHLVDIRAGPPVGFASKPFEKFTLTADGKVYRLDWSAGSNHNAPVLSPGQLYDFVLVEHNLPKRYGDHVWHSITRISHNGRVLFDSEICEVHEIALQEKFVPTEHGLMRFDPGWLEARKHLFPHSESGRSITCEGPPDEPPVTAIKTCPLCEHAYREWKQGRR